MSETKSGSPPCGLYITISDFNDMPQLVRDVNAFAYVINQSSRYEKNMHVVELVLGDDLPTAFVEFVGLLQLKGLVVLLSGHVHDEKADGVILRDELRFDDARMHYGSEGIIGADCASGELERGAVLDQDFDFVIFPANPDDILKWCKHSDIPVCARGQGITPENCGALVNAGAIFIDATEIIFNDEQNVAQSTIKMLEALENACDTDRGHTLN